MYLYCVIRKREKTDVRMKQQKLLTEQVFG